MCGIAGIVALDGFDPAKLIAMTQMIHYRGPSGYGFAYFASGTGTGPQIRYNDQKPPDIARPAIGLGNRRLAILDLSSNGSQPMQIGDGEFCLTYNGEIYNYREIRDELEALGHAFSTKTDTEVLLRSYAQWGESCLSKLNGMWSFALWDRKNQKLFCARDRLGVKPFYFVSTDRAFYFGSEIKQLLAASGVKRLANPRVVSDFLEWGLQDHLEDTSFEGVRQLLGGRSLSLTWNSSLTPRIATYWDLRTEPELHVTREDAIAEFRSRFADAVELRLRSDVPVGVSLSGGLDSSAILCQAKALAPSTTFRAFSACFNEPQIDEREYILTVTSATKSARNWTFPECGAFWDKIETIAYHQDEPIGGSSVFAQWSVMQDAQKNRVPVLLGGQGGDETLCGYRKYYFFYLWHLLRNGRPRFLSESFFLAQSGTRSHWSVGTVSRYLPSLLQKRISALRRLATPALRAASGDSRRYVGAAGNIAERQKIDLIRTSLPKLLRHEDRNSMAHSIETRMPFLDYRLAEFAVRCADSLKMQGGWSKWLLREAMAGTLPEPVRWRKSKLGFNAPESAWLREGMQNGHRSLWRSSDIRLSKWLEPKQLKVECERYLAGAAGALPAEVLFRALSLELWARVHDMN